MFCTTNSNKMISKADCDVYQIVNFKFRIFKNYILHTDPSDRYRLGVSMGRVGS
jgi:hypothetical protein